MDTKQRALEIFKTLRCLDCDSYDSSIEFVESPMAREQRAVVRALIRKGLKNRQIYHEIETIYGNHSILNQYYYDEISPDFDTKKYALGLAATSILFVGMMFIKKKKFNTKF